MYRATKRHSCQKSDHVSLPHLYEPCPSWKKSPSPHCHFLYMLQLFSSTYSCEQLFSKRKHRKNKISLKISDEQLETSLRMAVASIQLNQWITFTKMSSTFPLFLWFCCSPFSVLIKNIKNKMFCYAYTWIISFILWELLWKSSSYFVKLARDVRGASWMYGHRGWTFPKIFCCILLPWDRWQQRGSVTQ